jgi:sec-independent protein translocase protein TatA
MPPGFTPTHILVILIAALLILGPHRLTDVARQAGRALGEFRKWSDELKGEVRNTVSIESPQTPNGNGNGNGNGVTVPSDSHHEEPQFGPVGPFARPEPPATDS